MECTVAPEVTVPEVPVTVTVLVWPAESAGNTAEICVPPPFTLNDKLYPAHTTLVVVKRCVPVMVIAPPGSAAAVTPEIVGAHTVNVPVVVATPLAVVTVNTPEPEAELAGPVPVVLVAVAVKV